MEPVTGTPATAETYTRFGAVEVGHESPIMRGWSLGVADDAELLALIDTLPPIKRQPNLVLAAARWHGTNGPYDDLRRVLLEDWPAVRATILARATQTNEVGRCATLLPVLASLPGPLALIEVGASAGLCLHPDRYSYRFTRPGSDEVIPLDPAEGPSEVVLTCELRGDPPLPTALPEIGWRAGIDLNPLDVNDADAMAWLEILVWPEQTDRLSRLRAAVDVARGGPAYLVQGDLNEALPTLLEQVPAGLTPVVLHSAVLAYLSDGDRARFATMMTSLVDQGRTHWVSNEGARVLPSISATAGEGPSGTLLVLGLDGRAVAWTHGHGRRLHWL